MRIIDLSHQLSETIPSFPGIPAAHIENAFTIAENGFNEKKLLLYSHSATHLDAPAHIIESGFNEKKLLLYSHSATHLDAPAHIIENGKTLDRFPLTKFFGTGRQVRFNLRTDKISFSFLQPYLEGIFTADFLIINTGFSKKWGQKAYFEKFPVLTTQAAEALVQGGIKGVAIDTPSFDPVDSQQLPVHRLFLEKEVILIENLMIPGELPEKFIFAVFPLRIENGDGSPVRACAIIE